MAESRLIVITGVSRGLGRSMAEGFASRGHRIIGCARDAAALAELKSSLPGEHRFDSVDVAYDTAVSEWASGVLAETGTPSLLVNSAALINRNAPLWEIPADEFSQVVDVNIKGVTNVIRHFLPAMIDAGEGIVVNFSSGWGRSTSPDVAPYCATKWAIEGLSQALAQELPPGLAAVAFNPGIIDTDMLRSCFGGDASHYPDAVQWSERAVPYLESLTESHNGQALTCPGM